MTEEVTRSNSMTKDPLEVPRYRELAFHIATGKTQQEAMELSGVGGHSTLAKVLRHPKVIDFIQRIRAEQMEELEISRDDILRGFLSAISDAKTLGEPMTQIAGWREVGKFQGQYAPEEVNHNIKGSVEHVERRLKQMSMEELLAMNQQLEQGNPVIELEDDEWQTAEKPCPTNSAPAADEPSEQRPSSSKTKSATSSETTAQNAKANVSGKGSANKRSSASSSGQKKSGAGGRKSASRSTKKASG